MIKQLVTVMTLAFLALPANAQCTCQESHQSVVKTAVTKTVSLAKKTGSTVLGVAKRALHAATVLAHGVADSVHDTANAVLETPEFVLTGE